MTFQMAMSRRSMMQACGAALTAAAAAGPAAFAAPARFPKGFLWGASTSGHQVEGNNTNADMWLLEHVRPSIFREPSGDACDSLNRWEEDLDLVQALGLNSYRFGVEWSRIEPERGVFSQAYLDYYSRLIDGCVKRDIAPVLTFNHFSVPTWFAAQGHFMSPDGPQLFGRFCDRVARRMADRVAYGMTLNEPNAGAIMSWVNLPLAFSQGMQATLAAAAKAVNAPGFANAFFRSTGEVESLIQAHIQGYQAIKAARSDLPIGVGLSVDDDQADGSSTVRDAKRKAAYGAWFAVTRTHADYIGVQNYGRRVFDAKGQKPSPDGDLSGRENLPQSLGAAVRYAYEQTGKPVLVTENGVSTNDDAVRQAYIPNAVASLQAAMDGGVPTLGYIHWSLLDNFEWMSGYGARFGLVSVDRTTFKRAPKPSAQVLGAIARANGASIA